MTVCRRSDHPATLDGARAAGGVDPCGVGDFPATFGGVAPGGIVYACGGFGGAVVGGWVNTTLGTFGCTAGAVGFVFARPRETA